MVRPLAVFFIQTAIAGAVLMPTALFVLLSGGTYEGGLQSIGILVAPPIVTFFTITIVALVGLPIRLSPRRLARWRSSSWLVLLAAALGFVAVMVSFDPAFITVSEVEVEGMALDRVDAVWWLTFTGWFVLAFSLVHLWNPLRPGPDQQPQL